MVRARRPVVRAARPSLVGTAARTAVVVGTANAVSGNAARRQAATAAPQPAPAAAPPPPPAAPDAAPDRLAQLQQLADLKAQGILNDAEFEAEKARILAG